eukprot:UN03840
MRYVLLVMTLFRKFFLDEEIALEYMPRRGVIFKGLSTIFPRLEIFSEGDSS